MDNKLIELKRLAEKCPVQRFEPFIGRAGGRGTQAIFNADTKGEVITWSGFDSSDVASRTGREAIARFVAAANPETILALLAELEAKDREIAAANARVDVMCAKAMNLTERAESAEKQLATPVRLPTASRGKFNAGLTRLAIKNAGFTFTVEGDE
ncbi:ead/Ea22-like family protein [Serratia sp. PAMC26656]|uniref:ead/Ea22-like family protein n=1 Tax=Serratia sp. PAMC26656 TaxID=2775909 RepID=UPI0018F33D3E|nr:ead/Ea22-like family protein [Serratia sp. PAMC26656]MBJ7892221.1 ead/Ea22-like family protein [Serratia sp. PAMC26656]